MFVNRIDEDVILPSEYSSFPEIKARNILLMWRNVYLSSQLVDPSCDLVARLRYDNGFLDGTFDLILDSLSTLDCGIIIPEGGDNRGGIFDMFAIGDYRSMSVYSELYLNIHDYLANGVPATVKSYLDTILMFTILMFVG